MTTGDGMRGIYGVVPGILVQTDIAGRRRMHDEHQCSAVTARRCRLIGNQTCLLSSAAVCLVLVSENIFRKRMLGDQETGPLV